MACTSTVWSSIHSTIDKLGGVAADHPGIDDVETPFLVHGINKPEDLSRSFCIDVVRTHCYITLKPKPHYSPMQEPSNDLHASNSATTWPGAPPCSPEDSQYLQKALFDSYQSHRTNGTPIPANASSFIPPEKSSTSLDVLDSQGIVRSVINLSDSLADLHSIRSNQRHTITVQWAPVTNAVLNEASGTFGQSERITSLCAHLDDALNDCFRVYSEDGDWTLVEA